MKATTVHRHVADHAPRAPVLDPRARWRPPLDLASAFDPLTLANVLEVKATANAGGFPSGVCSVVAVDETATLREALDESAEQHQVRARARKTTGEILGFFDAAMGARRAGHGGREGPERAGAGTTREHVINPARLRRARDGGSVPFACAPAHPRAHLRARLPALRATPRRAHRQRPERLVVVQRRSAGLCVVDARRRVRRQPSTPPDDAAEAEGR